MSFSGNGSSGSISGGNDVALNNPALDEVLTYDSNISKWRNKNLGTNYVQTKTSQTLSDTDKARARKNIGANRTVLDVKADFGAIMDGSFHQLSEVYGSLAAAQAVYPHVTALTQQIDWAAWQGALNAADAAGGATVFHPGGDAVIGGLRLTTNTASIEGVSSDSCSIRWNGANGGIAFGDVSGNATVTSNRISIKRMSLNGTNATTLPILDVGFIVGCVFEEVNVQNSADNGIGIRLVRTQNSVFTKVSANHCGTNWLLDYEANGNVFISCYSNNPAKYMLEYGDNFAQNGKGPGHNSWYGCFFENTTSTSIAGIHALTGTLNTYTDCRFTQTDIPAANFAHLLYESGAAIPPQDTKFLNCRFGGTTGFWVLLQRNSAPDPVTYTQCTYSGFGTTYFSSAVAVDVFGNLPQIPAHTSGLGYIQHNGMYIASATSDQTLTNSQTLVDSQLVCQLSPNSSYLLEGWILYTTSVDARFSFTAPSDVAGTVSYDGLAATAASSVGSSDSAAISVVNPKFIGGTTAASPMGCTIRGFVNSTSKGRLCLQFAQRTADSSTITIKAGSWLKITKID